MSGLAGRAVLAIASLALFLVAAEGILSLARVDPLAGDEAYRRGAQQRDCQFGWRAAEAFCDPAKLASDGRRAIVALGGSSVAGYPLRQSEPFPVQLGRRLDRERPGRHRVFNRGKVCKDSTFVRDCGLRALAARPEWLIVYTGHNDFANWGLEHPGLRIWLEENAWVYDSSTTLAHSRLYSVLTRWLRRPPDLRNTITAPDPATTAGPRSVTLAKTESNLTTLFEAARRGGAKVIVVTVVSNLFEFPARRAEWDARPALMRLAHPTLSMWFDHYQAGIAADRAGDYDAALSAFELARDAYQQGRAHSELNERLRALAQRYPEVILVDFEQELEEIAREEGIGCNFFGDASYCDQFHPNRRTHELIAHALAREILRSDR